MLLVSIAPYAAPVAGAPKVNRAWLECLRDSGFHCRALSLNPVAPMFQADERRRKQIDDAGREPVAAFEGAPGLRLFIDDRIESLEADSPDILLDALDEQLRAWEPSWVLLSSEEKPGYPIVRQVHAAVGRRFVYLANTPQVFPFGPASLSPDPAATEAIRAGTVVAVCRTMAEYIETHAGMPANMLSPPVFGDGPFTDLGAFDTGYVTMVNPSSIKGVSIFLALAQRLTSVSFACVPSWATSTEDMRAIAAAPNIDVLPPYADVEDVLRDTKVLVAPSLWRQEGFGLVVIEAMLRGIPVVASDSGGLTEAKMGVDYVLPVNTIEDYAETKKTTRIISPSAAVVPPQNIEPWVDALQKLLTNRDHYEHVSRQSAAAARNYHRNIDREALGRLIRHRTIELSKTA
ncbi:MAG: glycosyltransferase family 4 protein [Myxococcota bacterium]